MTADNADSLETADTTAASDSDDRPDVAPAAAVEAILLTTDKPVSAAKLVDALVLAGIETDRAGIEAAVTDLNGSLETHGRAFRIETVAGGYRAMATDAVAPVLAAFHGARSTGRLSRAALETLAIVAYRQPVTRAEIEAIRGVASGEVLRALLERKLVVVAGRAEELGRPMLYGTSKNFLESFGLAALGDLPTIDGIPPAPEAESPRAEAAEIEPAEAVSTNVDPAATDPADGADTQPSDPEQTTADPAPPQPKDDA
ncbi:MAG: SMC-Scp complex subunit ScpB [Planctomycetota bacterium]